jgi:hypothetical protein
MIETFTLPEGATLEEAMTNLREDLYYLNEMKKVPVFVTVFLHLTQCRWMKAFSKKWTP